MKPAVESLEKLAKANVTDGDRDEIDTPEEFIELCATRSLLSGKPYQVINKHGETVDTSEWLTAELNEYRNSATAGVR